MVDNNNDRRLSDLSLFTFCKSKISKKKYILLANDGEHITYYMEDKRGNLPQCSSLEKP